MDYYNCQRNPTVSALARYIANDALEKISNVKRLETICTKHHRKFNLENIDIPVQIVGHAWSNGSCVRGRKQLRTTTWTSWTANSCNAESEMSCQVPHASFKNDKEKRLDIEKIK